MKKLFSLFMALALLCTILPAVNFNAFAYQASVEKTRLGTSDTYYEYDSSTATLTISGTGATPSFGTSGGEQPWYEYRDTDIDSVIIEDGITVLGGYLLYNVCASTIVLPKTLKQIGTYSLAQTYNVSEYELPFGLEIIGSNAFYGCNGLTEIVIPDTVTVISMKAFQRCSNLESVVIPYSVTNIGSYAFANCASLSNVDFQSLTSTVSIGSYCFFSNASLIDLSLPMGASLGDYAFGYKSKTVKYEDAVMRVFYGTGSFSYAVLNDIEYTLIDVIPMSCAVWYSNTFTDINIDDSFEFSFIADSTVSYNFYSTGDCDTSVEIRDSLGNTVAQNDDVDISDRNFLASALLNEGEQYSVFVSSYHSTGNFNVIVYPDVITSASVYGELRFNALDGDYTGSNPYFEITDNMLSTLIITVCFENGLSDQLYCYDGMFDAKHIGYSDNQAMQPFNCGSNTAVISVGDIDAGFNIDISHGYRCNVISYTVDDDGYSVYTCALCGTSYIDDYVPTPAIKVSGVLVFAEDKNNSHSSNTPYPYADITVDGRHYDVGSDGSWCINSFESCDIVFDNQIGENITISADLSDCSEYSEYNYGYVAINGYDLTGDGYVNGKDFGKYLHDNGDNPDEYWKFIKGFLK